MPRSVRKKSSIMDLSKLARRQNNHPYNLRTRNRCMNYNEIHLSNSAMTGSRRRHRTVLKPLTASIVNDGNSQQPNAVENPCSSNSLEHNRSVQDRGPPETTTLYVNEDFGKSTETSSTEVVEEEDDAETEQDSQSANTTEVEDNAMNSSDDADLSDNSYRRNYSASAYSYRELIGHSNTYHITRSASQSRVRTEVDLGENLRDFDALATGDGGHNDPNILEFSVRILDNNENYY